jgi:hypothetical protein
MNEHNNTIQHNSNKTQHADVRLCLNRGQPHTMTLYTEAKIIRKMGPS